MAHGKDISLGEKFGSEPSMPKKNEMHFPTLHIHNKDLPLKDSDVGKEKIAVIMVKVERISKSADNKGGSNDYMLEVKSINLAPGKIPHYST